MLSLQRELTTGDSAMMRKLLLPFLATAALAGCATGYNYRGGNGDYYYGQPRVEYPYGGIGGFYGNFGPGFGGNYYYDRYGRLVYGYPGGYYGGPYYGGNGWYRPRPHHGQGDHDGDDSDRGDHDRPPPWRDLGGLKQRDENRDRQRPRPVRSMISPDAPMRQRAEAPAPITRQRSESSSRMGGFIQGATRAHGKRTSPPQE